MKSKKFSVIVLGLCVLLAVPLIGCGDDNGNGGAQFKAMLGNYSSGRDDAGMPVEPVSGIIVKALNHSTGEELGIETKSDARGWVVLNDLPSGKVGFLAEGIAGELVDTYQFDIDSDAQEEVLWVVDFNTYDTAPKLAGITVDPTKGIAAGALYWKDDQGCEYPIGCGTIKTDPETGEIRYFHDNEMPTTVDIRSDINPLNGYWLVANIDPGGVTVNGYMADTQLGSTSFFVYADSICIGNVYVEGASNPQPQDCLPQSVATRCP